MKERINLREISQGDRYAPDEEYALSKAQRAIIQRPQVYRIEGDDLIFDTHAAALNADGLKKALHWGYQWNSDEI